MSVAYIVQRVSSSDVAGDPFPHLVVDNVLPADLHALVVHQLPPFDALLPLSESGARDLTAYSRRASRRVDPPGVPVLGEAVQEAASALVDPAVQLAVAARFGGGVLGDVDASVREVRLDCDQPGAAMGAHTDAPGKLLTCVIYLHAGADVAGNGTRLLRPARGWERSGGGADYNEDTYAHEEERGFATIREVDFVPNRALVFARRGDSFHSYGPVSAAGAPRYIFNFSVKRSA